MTVGCTTLTALTSAGVFEPHRGQSALERLINLLLWWSLHFSYLDQTHILDISSFKAYSEDEVLEACIRAVGASKVGIRLCPWETFNGMFECHLHLYLNIKITVETRLQNPVPQYAYFVKQIVDRYPDLAYVHVTEPRLSGNWEIHDPVDEVLPHPYI